MEEKTTQNILIGPWLLDLLERPENLEDSSRNIDNLNNSFLTLITEKVKKNESNAKNLISDIQKLKGAIALENNEINLLEALSAMYFSASQVEEEYAKIKNASDAILDKFSVKESILPILNKNVDWVKKCMSFLLDSMQLVGSKIIKKVKEGHYSNEDLCNSIKSVALNLLSIAKNSSNDSELMQLTEEVFTAISNFFYDNKQYKLWVRSTRWPTGIPGEKAQKIAKKLASKVNDVMNGEIAKQCAMEIDDATESAKKTFNNTNEKKDDAFSTYYDLNDEDKNNLKRKIECRHFNPKRAKKKQKIYDLAKQKCEARLSIDRKKTEIAIDENLPMRHLMTAECSLIESSLALFKADKETQKNKNNQIDTEMGWVENQWKSSEYKGNDLKYSNEEILFFKATHRERPACVSFFPRCNPRKPRFGDGKVKDITGQNKYEDFIGFINSITGTNKEKEMQLAAKMRLFCAGKGQIRLTDMCSSKKPYEIEELEITFTKICYTMIVKEPTDWLRSKAKSVVTPPFTIAMARALALIEAGKLAMKDVFSIGGSHTLFAYKGIQDNFWEIENHIELIDKLYCHAFCAQGSDNCKGECGTIKTLKKDLRETFGGESDTDYEDDNFTYKIKK